MVVCPSCSAEVSPYVTECPYCGKRIQKRAPKLGSVEQPSEPTRKGRRRADRAKRSKPKLPRVDRAPGSLVAVPGLVIVAATLSVLVRAGAVRAMTVAVLGHLQGDWYKLLTAPFAHRGIAYAFTVLAIFAIFGARIERRFAAGSLLVILIWLISGAGGAWLSAELTLSPASGALAPAFAVTVACAIGALEQRRDGGEADLAGPGVALAVLCLLPPLVVDATWWELFAGAIVGIGTGTAIAVADRRR